MAQLDTDLIVNQVQQDGPYLDFFGSEPSGNWVIGCPLTSMNRLYFIKAQKEVLHCWAPASEKSLLYEYERDDEKEITYGDASMSLESLFPTSRVRPAPDLSSVHLCGVVTSDL